MVCLTTLQLEIFQRLKFLKAKLFGFMFAVNPVIFTTEYQPLDL